MAQEAGTDGDDAAPGGESRLRAASEPGPRGAPAAHLGDRRHLKRPAGTVRVPEEVFWEVIVEYKPQGRHYFDLPSASSIRSTRVLKR